MLKIKFKKLYADSKLPVKGSLDAACYDVYAHSSDYTYPGKVTYNLGFATEIPKGYRAVIVPRSNLSKHKWVLGNSIGIIDSDYRGEWMVNFHSLRGDYQTPPYAVGERIAQVYFEPILDVEFEEVDDISDTQRGSGGFGSTGLN